MRPVLAALVLVLSACGPAAVEPLCAPSESRSCACTSGAMGAQVCGESRQRFEPCVCDGTDGGVDAGHPELVDAGADAGGVAPHDAGVDAAVADGGPADGGPRDGGPVDAGRCTIVPQSGCPAGQACRYQYTSMMRTGIACEPAGIGIDGQTCERFDGGGDSCAPGYWCSFFCRRSCNTDADCPALDGRSRVCDPGGTAGPFCVFAP